METQKKSTVATEASVPNGMTHLGTSLWGGLASQLDACICHLRGLVI